MKQFLASSISHIFSPFVLWPVNTILLVLFTGLSRQQQMAVAAPLFFVELVLPIALFIILLKMKVVTDMEVTNYKERRWLFIGIIIAHSLAVLVLWKWGTELAWQLRLLALVLEVLGTIVTFFWKISAHLATASFVIVMLAVLVSPLWWWAALILPAVAWSRIVRKKHTLAQTIAGAGLTLLLSGIGLTAFHII